MENASKALLIAGAILICILLIGVGMMVMNAGQSGIDEAIASMSEQQKEMFNQKFSRYAGTRVSGNNVKALLQNVIASNNENQDIKSKLVEVDGTGANLGSVQPAEGDSKANDLSSMRTKVNTGNYYNVELEYGKDTGLINKIKIKTADSSNG